jgi:hypothetical protein
MKRLLPLVLAVSLSCGLTASGALRIESKTWKNVQTYDVRELSKTLDSHLGQIVGIKFNFRSKETRHLKPNWYESALWQPDPKGKKGFSDVRVMVAKKDLKAFQSLPRDSTTGTESTVYGKVMHDPDANFAFVRLIGRNTIVDPAGNAVVSW